MRTVSIHCVINKCIELYKCIRIMAPKSGSDNFVSSLGIKVPRNRADHITLSSDRWLDDKREDDGAEGLWRIHDNLYDLTDFVERHPGGSMWLQLTKGTDITEAYESHHISKRVENMLPKFHVRQAATPRNSPFTFHEEGFYKQLKNSVREILPTIPAWATTRNKILTDLLLIAYLGMAMLSAIYNSYLIALVAGMCLACVTVASHNYFHQKDSFRMYYFDLSLMSSRDWRISHALSHHLYTNTIIDLEIQMFEPLLPFLPMQKSFFVKYFSWIYSPLFYLLLFPLSYTKRLIAIANGKKIDIRDIIPLFVPVLMYVTSGQPALEVMKQWLSIVLVGSFHFSLVGINAAHHRPDVFHDGDTPRTNTMDWGVAQLDAVMDRHDINSSSILVLTNFGEHGLHHLFPTVDHGKLPYLYPAFEKVCARFGVKLRTASQISMIKGQFMQLLNTTPNPFPPEAI